MPVVYLCRGASTKDQTDTKEHWSIPNIIDVAAAAAAGVGEREGMGYAARTDLQMIRQTPLK